MWKVYLQAEDGGGNAGIETKSFRVVPPAVPGTNLARGRPATASSFQTSANGTDWTTVHSTTTGDGGVDDIDAAGSGRYVRVAGTVRGTSWGYSLYEFGVYATH